MISLETMPVQFVMIHEKLEKQTNTKSTAMRLALVAEEKSYEEETISLVMQHCTIKSA